MDYLHDWIEEYLSPRQIREMEFFFPDLRRTAYRNHYNDYDYWNEIKGKEGIRDRIRKVKAMCDDACRLAKEAPTDFLHRWDREKKKDTNDGHPSQQERVFSCVHDAYLESAVRPRLWAKEFDGPPHIFRKIDRGNPDWKENQKVTREEVVEEAESLLAERGPEAYPTRRNADHQTGFLEDVGERLGVSGSRVKTHLTESNWCMPDECYLAKQANGLN